MSFAEMLQNLPGLTVEQRQLVIRRALELDDVPPSDGDILIAESRLDALRENPASGVSLEDMKARVRSHRRG